MRTAVCTTCPLCVYVCVRACLHVSAKGIYACLLLCAFSVWRRFFLNKKITTQGSLTVQHSYWTRTGKIGAWGRGQSSVHPLLLLTFFCGLGTHKGKKNTKESSCIFAQIFVFTCVVLLGTPSTLKQEWSWRVTFYLPQTIYSSLSWCDTVSSHHDVLPQQYVHEHERYDRRLTAHLFLSTADNFPSPTSRAALLEPLGCYDRLRLTEIERDRRKERKK